MRVAPVVNSILRIGLDSGAKDLSHLKIQKLLYFLNGWYLATQGKPVVDESFEAWQYGPVVPSLYHILRKYGSNPLDRLLRERDSAGEERAFIISKDNDKFWDILERVWAKYGKLSATQLSTLSHESGSPWDRARLNQTIDDQSIREYFLSLSKKST